MTETKADFDNRIRIGRSALDLLFENVLEGEKPGTRHLEAGIEKLIAELAQSRSKERAAETDVADPSPEYTNRLIDRLVSKFDGGLDVLKVATRSASAVI